MQCLECVIFLSVNRYVTCYRARNCTGHLNIRTETVGFHTAARSLHVHKSPICTLVPHPLFAQRINAHVWKPRAVFTQGIRIHYIPLRSSDGLSPTATEITFRSNVPISLTITSLNWLQWFVTCSNGLTLRGRPMSDNWKIKFQAMWKPWTTILNAKQTWVEVYVKM